MPPANDAAAALEREAAALLTIRLGDEPLVPLDVGRNGSPHDVVAAGMARLAALRVRRLRTTIPSTQI